METPRVPREELIKMAHFLLKNFFLIQRGGEKTEIGDRHWC